MPSLGDHLRSHRESRGVPLEEIAASTRITVSQLKALEQERFELLPGGVFNVSFVRQYARHVGLDEDEAVAMLKAATDVSVPFGQPPSDERDPYLAAGPLGRIAEMLRTFLREKGGNLASFAIGIALIVGGFYFYQNWEAIQGAANLAQEQPPQEVRTVPATLVEPAREASAGRPKEPAPPQSPIELRVRITDTVWLRADADGERVLEGIFRAGDAKPISARQEVTMRVGNAGGVALDLNGKELPPLGPSGAVRRISVTPEGMAILDPPERREGAPVNSVRVPTTTAAVRWAELAWSPITR